MIFTALWLSIFILLFGIQLFYQGIIFGKLAFYKQKITQPKSFPAVSVIICAKNEAENLRTFLPAILTQDYPAFEVVIVNDASTDDTANVLTDLAAQYSLLRIVTITAAEERPFRGKKTALLRGINAAQNDLVLVSDADCYPATPSWIRGMVEALGDKEIVLGYSPYKKEKGILNAWIRWEAIYTAMQYFSLALWGYPYMGVGRNLLYYKRLFVEKNNFSAHGDLPSGDDDLFISAVATAKNTAICIDNNTFMYSLPKQKWGDYYRQKTRHLSTSPRYPPLIIGLLLGLSVSLLGFYAIAIIGLFCVENSFTFVTILFCIRWILMLLTHILIKKKLGEKGLALSYLWGDWGLLLFLTVFSASFIVRKKYIW